MINNMIRNAMRTEWALTDEFIFTFNNTKYSLGGTDLKPQDIWDINTINIDIPQYSSSVNDVVMGGTRRIYSSLFDVFTLSVTFRDVSGMGLRNYFTKIWAAQTTNYFDDIKSTVQISSAGEVVFHSDDCLVSDVSQIQLNNDNNQIVEFTVTFNCTSFSTNELGKYGKPGYINLK